VFHRQARTCESYPETVVGVVGEDFLWHRADDDNETVGGRGGEAVDAVRMFPGGIATLRAA
jgi:hypothetical protein